MTVLRVGRLLAESARGQVVFDRVLARYTTYRLGGAASVYFEPESGDDLLRLRDAVAAAGVDPAEVPLLPVGRGSNMVVSDRGFDGIAIRLAPGLSWIEGHPDDDSSVEAGGGTSLPLLANWAARRSLSGLEFTVGIPGSVGGGVRMNAGAHDGSIADTLEYADVFDLGSGINRRPAGELGLTYRHSDLADHEVVVAGAFRLQPGDEAEIRGRMEGYRKHRAETQPGALQNAGSTFKNPPGDSAGRLVDAAGLKGHRVGGAKVSDLHANFFIAEEGATAQDVFDLVSEVRRLVAERMGVELEPEVRFVGPFDSATTSLAGAR